MHFVTVFTRLKCCCLNSNVFVWSYKYSRPITNKIGLNYFSWNRKGRKIHEIKYTRKIQVLQYVGWVGSWVVIVVILWVGLGLYVCGLGYENGPMDNPVCSFGVRYSLITLAQNWLKPADLHAMYRRRERREAAGRTRTSWRTSKTTPSVNTRLATDSTEDVWHGVHFGRQKMSSHWGRRRPHAYEDHTARSVNDWLDARGVSRNALYKSTLLTYFTWIWRKGRGRGKVQGRGNGKG